MGKRNKSKHVGKGLEKSSADTKSSPCKSQSKHVVMKEVHPKKKFKTSINIDKLKSVLQKNVPTNQPGRTVGNLTSEKVASTPLNSLALQAKQQLESSHFRFLNQQLYTMKSSEAWNIFQGDPQSFFVYHKGFENQVTKWPVNPLDLIIKDLKKQPKTSIVADFGCGTARLASSLPNKVHSFDLVAANELVTACDMANVPLSSCSVDAAVFCLSLMGTNVNDFLLEANRVLKIGGVLHIAEVESRCPNVNGFLKAVEKFGFNLEKQDAKQNFTYFFLAKFTKNRNLSKKSNVPIIQLKPCLYKKR